MNTSIELTPFDLIKVSTALEEVHGGTLAIGHALQEWVSSEITPEQLLTEVQKVGRAYLPLLAFGLNGFRSLARLQTALFEFYRLDEFEAASRYACPYSGMHPWALVPLGVLAKDASVYQKAFTAPGTWAYMYDMATAPGRDRHLENQVGGRDTSLESVLGSVALSMMGSGYENVCLDSDGRNERKLVTVDFENGDKLVCAAWIWYNN